MVIPANPAAILAVTDGVAEALRNKPGVVGHEFEIELALQEALANAIRHGCQGDTDEVHPAAWSPARTTGDVLIVVRDPGRDSSSPDVPNPLDGDQPAQGEAAAGSF